MAWHSLQGAICYQHVVKLSRKKRRNFFSIPDPTQFHDQCQTPISHSSPKHITQTSLLVCAREAREAISGLRCGRKLNCGNSAAAAAALSRLLIFQFSYDTHKQIVKIEHKTREERESGEKKILAAIPLPFTREQQQRQNEKQQPILRAGGIIS
jgi:hypothetical protein